MEINQEQIEAAIIEQAVKQVVGDEDVYNRVRNGVESRLNILFESTAKKQIEDAVGAAIRAGFDHSYCKVDYMGRPTGEPTTISAELNKMIGGYWNQSVDKQGKSLDNNNSYNSFGTRAEWLMAQMVAADFKGEMKQHVVNIGGALKDKLRLELHETVNGLMSEVFHVKTPGDEAAKNSGRACIDPPMK